MRRFVRFTLTREAAPDPFTRDNVLVIARQGCWAPHSKVLAGYLEVVDQWEDNALLGVL
ncbi:hypothetical protein ACFVTP_09025 [Streptomyces celluloflavus]|uniref:hypothetical protein n=1 Tax=Streptomyces celluloflavus TaxID=58344 RepID=UPI0036DD62BD